MGYGKHIVWQLHVRCDTMDHFRNRRGPASFLQRTKDGPVKLIELWDTDLAAVLILNPLPCSPGLTCTANQKAILNAPS